MYGQCFKPLYLYMLHILGNYYMTAKIILTSDASKRFSKYLMIFVT